MVNIKTINNISDKKNFIDTLLTHKRKRLKRHKQSGGFNKTKKKQRGGVKDHEIEIRIEASIVRNIKTTFDDIIGLDSAKKELKNAIVMPIKFKSLFERNKIKPPTGIMMYGPPGTGKTLLAKATANSIEDKEKITFFNIDSANITSQFVGVAPKFVDKLFNTASQKAQETGGISIIFIDEADSILGSRGGTSDNESSTQIKNQFLTKMDGAASDMNGVIVVIATNLPWNIDSAFYRRFQRRIFINIPSDDDTGRDQRIDIIKHLMNYEETSGVITPEDFYNIGENTKYYSPSDLNSLVGKTQQLVLEELTSANAFRLDLNGNYVVCDLHDPRNLGYFKSILKSDEGADDRSGAPGSTASEPTASEPTAPGSAAASEPTAPESATTIEDFTFFFDDIPQEDMEKVQLPPIKYEHFETALQEIKSTSDKETIDRLKNWNPSSNI